MFLNAVRMAKTSAKLIFRSKAFLVLGILIPMVSTFLINIWFTKPLTLDESSIYELSSLDEQMAYTIDFNRFPVKVYDTVNDDSSRRILQGLHNSGMFQIFHADASSCTREEIEKSMKESAKSDRVGAVIILAQNAEETELYRVTDDERFSLLSDCLGQLLSNPSASIPAPKISFVAFSGDEVDYYATRNFAYCLAFSTLAFVFAGIMILGTILSEKKDKVFDRIMMTRATRISYLFSKFLLVVGITLVQSLVMVITYFLLVRVDLGIGGFFFFLCCFCQGLVFSLLSLCVGLICNSISSGTIMAFTMWSISDLISGTYFDLSHASDLFKKVSLLMPQRWALFSTTRILHGNSSGYSLLLGTTAAYLVIIFVVSVVAVKLGEQE